MYSGAHQHTYPGWKPSEGEGPVEEWGKEFVQSGYMTEVDGRLQRRTTFFRTGAVPEGAGHACGESAANSVKACFALAATMQCCDFLDALTG